MAAGTSQGGRWGSLRAAPGSRDLAGGTGRGSLQPLGSLRLCQVMPAGTHTHTQDSARGHPHTRSCPFALAIQIHFSESLAQCVRTNPTPGHPSQKSNWVLPSKPLGSKEFSTPISLFSLDSTEIGSCCSFRLRSSGVHSASLWHTWPVSA